MSQNDTQEFDVQIYFDENLSGKPSQLLSSISSLAKKFKQENTPYHSNINLLLQSDYVFVSTIEPSFTKNISTTSKVINIPYAMSIASGTYWQTYQYNRPLHNSAYLIFTMNNYYKERFQSYCNIGAQHVIPIGYSKYDVIFNYKKKYTKTPNDKKVFMWNVHYNMAEKFSTWPTIGKNLFDYFCNRKDITILFRPHPFFFWNIARLMGKAEADRIRNLALDNFILDESDTYLDAFYRSDALITDASSVLIDYTVMSKPICFTNNGDPRQYLNEFTVKLIEDCTHLASSVGDIELFINKVILNDEGLMKNSEQFLNEDKLLGPIDGSVGSKIVEIIRKDNK